MKQTLFYITLIILTFSHASLALAWRHVSPYAYCAGDPVNRIDVDGDNPIYSTFGVLLGTADNGIQGNPIIMDEKFFDDKMTYEDAQFFDLGVDGLVDRQSRELFYQSYNSLNNRPDWDGYITLEEANDWYRNGNGQSLYTDLSQIDLSLVYSLGDSFVGQTKNVNLLTLNGPTNDGLVYGNITLKRYPNNTVRAYADKYDFDIKSNNNPLNWGRNFETVIGRCVAGEGQSYNIMLYGTATLTPLFPWIK